jgi:hypothetical protein
VNITNRHPCFDLVFPIEWEGKELRMPGESTISDLSPYRYGVNGETSNHWLDVRSLNQNCVIGEIEKLLGLNEAKGFERDVLVRSIACRTLGAFMPTDYVGSILTHHFTDIRFTGSLAEA